MSSALRDGSVVLAGETLCKYPNCQSKTILSFSTPSSLGEGLIEAGEFRGVMANLGDSFNHEEIGQLMLMCDLNADNKFAIDDIVAFGQKYS